MLVNLYVCKESGKEFQIIHKNDRLVIGYILPELPLTSQVFLYSDYPEAEVSQFDNNVLQRFVELADDIIAQRVRERLPIGIALSGQAIGLKIDNAVYLSSEPQQILDALPGWLRRLVVWYAKRRMNRD